MSTNRTDKGSFKTNLWLVQLTLILQKKKQIQALGFGSGGVAGIWTQDRQRPRLVSWTKLDDDPLLGGKIITTLIKLKVSGLAESPNVNVW